MVELSIIILNYKQRGLVKQCVKGILSLCLVFDYEIIVVDNDSRDGCLKMIKKQFNNSRIKTIQSDKNLGMGAGNNLGIRQAQGEYILILNPDITLLEGAIEKMIKFMKESSRVGILAPKLLNPDRSVQYAQFRFPDFWRPLYRRTLLGKTAWGKKRLEDFLMFDWDRKSARKIDWALGACLLIRKLALDSIGLFDERFFLFFEDTDLCRRFWNNSWEVWCLPEAEMVHYPERLSAKKINLQNLFSKPVRAHLISQMKYFCKWRKYTN
ncbi:glycosyltransferase family 2 protein [Patescibacteria group bacterium]|nr:glycosyltransferase family 2 protein [Patescibacteria group bacterium]MBU4512907.1 glycosyltransferase family 2 protein [Patescibacteria group bacterium]